MSINTDIDHATDASSRPSPLLLTGFILFWVYIVLIGLSSAGVLIIPSTQPMTLGVLGVAIAATLVAHFRNGWVWHASAMDGLVVVWLVALSVSIAANWLTWRRSAEAMWYLMLYPAVFYWLLHLLHNRVLSRQVLVELMLIVGFFVMMPTVWQLVDTWDGETWIRPSGFFRNPNLMGGYLVVIIPLALGQLFQAKQLPVKAMLGVYTLLAFVLLVWTYSRGAWIAMIAGLATWLLLAVLERGLLSPIAFRKWWQKQSQRVRLMLISGAGVLLLIIAGFTWQIIRSLSMAGRSVGLRTYLWEATLRMFAEQPLTGQGVFTYGHHLARYNSIPPGNPQGYAHSLFFQIIGEVGLLGIAAMLLSLAVLGWCIWRNWQALTGDDRAIFKAALVALAGFLMHHLLDMPSILPAIAVTGIVILVLVMFPANPTPLTGWRKHGRGIAFVTVWALLLIVGAWQATIRTDYKATLNTLTDTLEQVDEGELSPVEALPIYAEGAEKFASIVARDPRQPAYLWQTGHFYGLAAAEGDLNAAQNGVDYFERYLALEPTHSVMWANVAALYWQLGDEAAAQDAIDQAVALAPDWEHYQRQAAIYAGTLTDAPTIDPPEPSRAGEWWGEAQYMRQVASDEYIPQLGWGSERP